MSDVGPRVAAGLLGLFMTVSSQAQAASPVIYKNSEFGIYTVLHREACSAPSTQNNHGFTLPLDGKHMDCDEVFNATYFDVYAEYNAAFYPDARSRLNERCHFERGQLSTAPLKIAIVGHASASSLCTLAGNWVDLIVVTQTGQWSSDKTDPESKIAYVNVIITLHTPRQDLRKNIAIFEDRLKALRIMSPEPPL